MSTTAVVIHYHAVSKQLAGSISNVSMKQTSIGKRALGLRRALRAGNARIGITAMVDAATSTHTNIAKSRARNYTARVLAGEFEPTALRAREIAAATGVTLHKLAQDLGYADAPPKIRRVVDLGVISRSDLAERTGYDVTDISRTFARKHPPTLTKLARLAAAYGMWMDDMLTALGW